MITKKDIGRPFTVNREGETKFFIMQSWCDLPTFTLVNVRTHTAHTYTTAQIKSLDYEAMYTETEVDEMIKRREK